MLIMLKVDGTWEDSHVFCNKRTCGLIVPDETLYIPFVDLVYSCIGAFRANERLKISYLVDECPPPVVVNDDYSLCFYMALKKSEPDYAKYPLCVELFPLSVSTLAHFSSQVPAFDLNVSANDEFDHVDDPSDVQHRIFDVPSAQPEDMSFNMYGTNAGFAVHSNDADSLPTLVSGSSNDVSSPTSSDFEVLAVNEHFDLESFCDFQDIQVICHFHPTRIAFKSIYQDKRSLSHHLKMYAILNLFQYTTKTSTKKVLHVVCVDEESCEWAVRAVRLDGSEMFQIRRFDSVHTCSLDVRQGPHRQATTEIIAELIKHRYADASRKPYAPKDIIVDLNRDYGLTIPYKKAWLANKKAQEKLMGSDEQSYQLLPSIAYVLNKKHPGSLVLLDVGVHNRFKSFFMSLDAWIQGWKHCFPVLIIDGSFMKAYYKGTLLTACAQDANNQIFPLAFGVVDTERRKTWTWFFMKLKECLAHREDLYIVSDRHDGIIHAAKVVFPHAEHGYCAYHILGNIRSKFKGSTTGLAWKFNQAARAATPTQFEEYMTLLDAEDPRIRDYLDEIGLQKWARCFCTRSRYSLMTSNNAESVNSMDRVPREYPIAKLIDFLRGRMQKWFCERRDLSSTCKTILSSHFESQLRSYHAEAALMTVNPASQYEFEVVDRTSRSFVVNLKDKTCSCCEFQLDQFICVHGVAVVGHRRGLSCYDYISKYYFTREWVAAYKGEVHPLGSRCDWGVPASVASEICRPPTCLTRQPGRPKKKRIPSTGEFGSRQRCSRCKKGGHNKKSCTNPIPSRAL